jgi:NADH dehydrogenase
VNDNEKMLVRVVVLGAGFGGLTFCKHFRRSGVLVTVVDRTNHRLFQPLLTIVIVGGGPTGLELAGTFAELARTVLKRDVRRIDPTPARIILLEGGPRVLSNYPPELSESAKLQLEGLGVQVRTSTPMKNIREGEVELAGGEIIRAGNIIWAAGVSAAPLTKKLGVELDKAGRVKVNPDLSVPGHPEIFAIGDLALVMDKDGQPVPGICPAAMQMGRHVARIIEYDLNPNLRGTPTVP